jgi:hypothetical protein
VLKTAQKVDNKDRENAEISEGTARDRNKQSRKKTVSSPQINDEDTLEKSRPALMERRTPFSDVIRCEGYLTQRVDGHDIAKYYILREDGFLYSFARQDSSFAETTLDTESTVVFRSSASHFSLLTCSAAANEFYAPSESELTMW